MKRPDTRQQILQLAETLIRKKGYNSFSYHEIAATLNIRNAAVHYHFSTKEILGLEVVTENIRRFKLFRERVEGLPASAQLDEFIKTYTENCEEGKVCLVGAISVEYDGLPASLTEAMRGLTSVISGWLTESLAAGRASGAFIFKQDPHQKALMIITNLAAGIQLARFAGRNAYEDIVQGIRIDLSLHP